MFSMVTVASSTRMPTASARPPSVMMLMVSPSALSTSTEERMESGMETAMISVLRQLPRKMRIIRPVRAAAMTASRITPSTEARTKMDWSASGCIFRSGGRVEAMRGQQVARAGDNIERGAFAGFEDRDERAALAIQADDVGLRREAVAHVGDVADINGGVADLLDGKIVHLFDLLGAGVEIHVVFELADFGGAGGQNQVLLIEGGHHVGGRDPFRLQQRGVEIDHHLALLAAVRVGNGGARDRDQLGADEVEAEIAKLLLGERLARKPELQDRHAGGVVGEHQRRHHAGRHLAQDSLRRAGHLGGCGIHAGVGLQEDLHHRQAVHRHGFHVFHVVHQGGEDALVDRSHAAFHLLGRHSGVIPNDGDDGNVDFRENVSRRPQNDDRAQNENEQGEHHESVRSIESDFDDPHKGLPKWMNCETIKSRKSLTGMVRNGTNGKRTWSSTRRRGAPADPGFRGATDGTALY